MGFPLPDCPILHCRSSCFQATRLAEQLSLSPDRLPFSVTHCPLKIRACPVDNNNLQTILARIIKAGDFRYMNSEVWNKSCGRVLGTEEKNERNPNSFERS
jgi:hypothetical protein